MSAIPKADPEADNHRIMLEGDIPMRSICPPAAVLRPGAVFAQRNGKNKMPELTHVGDGHYVACHKYNSGIPQGDPLMP